MKPLSNRFLTTSCLTAAMLLAVPAFANPADGVVASGAANISASGNTLHVVQSTHKAVIDWGSFNIGAGETTAFHQPSSSAITLNRVHSASASVIDGNLTANGNIFIVNQNGVLFGAGSRVDVNGLVVSTADISNHNFNAGNFRFDQPGNPTATIENRGQITAAEAGLVGMVAPNVLNSGTINARLGRVHLASGDTATVDLYGDGLMEVAVSDAVTSQLVRNTGTIAAEGGTIALTAAAGGNLVNSLIEVRGELRAPSVGVRNGKIIIAAAKAKQSGISTVVVEDALLDVSGNHAGETGGRVTITSDRVAVMGNTMIDANGAEGGGIVHIGGEYLGGGKTPTALITLVQDGVTVNASALVHGHGGEVIMYADERTEFGGSIEANGAGDEGNGGFVETSGRNVLLVFGRVRTIAGRNGKAGTWLLDPADIDITASTTSNAGGSPNWTASGTTAQVSAATIVSSLNGGTNVTITTSNDGHAGNGDITVSSAISTTGSGSLTLSAYRSITVNAAIALNAGTLTLQSNNAGAANGSTGTGAVKVAAAISTTSGDIKIGGGSGAISAGSGYAVGDGTYLEGVKIVSNVTSTSGGNIVINGRGYATGTSRHGVSVASGAIVSTVNSGAITIYGLGGGNGGGNYGINVSGSTIRNTGSGAVQLTGVGGASSVGGSTSDIGIWVGNAGTLQAANNDLTLTGTGGGSAGTSQNYGVATSGTGALVETTGSGNIVINGIEGLGTTNTGFLANYTTVSNIMRTTGSGNITINTNSISLATGAIITSIGTLTLRPYTTSTTMGIGPSSGSALNVSTTYLGTMTAASYVFGSTTTGNLTINTTKDFGASNVSFLSSGNITLAGTLTKGTGAGTATYLLQANGNITMSGYGIAANSGSINLTLDADYDYNGAGYISLISGSITTGGGNVVMGGGTTPSTLYANNLSLSAYSVDAQGGNITMNGAGTSSGLAVLSGSTIKTTNNGTIALTGRAVAASGNAYAININSGTSTTNLIETQHGSITLNGDASGGTNNIGVMIQSTGSPQGTSIVRTTGSGNINVTGTGAGGADVNMSWYSMSSATGNITFTANSGTLYAGYTISAGNTLTFQNRTAGTTIGVGSGNTFIISDTSLATMSAANYVFGSTTAGNVNISTTKDFGTANVSFISGGNITLPSDLTKTSGAGTATYLLQANGNISNNSGKGISATTGAINLTMTSDYDVSGSGSITLTSAPLTVNGGTITLNSNGQSVTQSGSIGGDETINSSNGAVSIGALEADTASTRSLTANAGTATFTTTAAIGATNKLNNLTVVSNDVALGANLNGSGTLTLQPNASNSEVRLNDATAGGTYTLSSTELGYFVNGWSGITIGKSTNSGSMYIGTTSWSDPVTFLNNFRTSMTNSLTASGNASVTFNVGGSGWINQASIVTAGQNVSFSGAGAITGASNITTSGGSISAVTVQVNGSAASPTWSTSGGNINITGTLMRNSSAGSTAAKTFTMNAGSGTISVAGTINGDYSLSATGSTITLSGAVGGTEALGTLSLTATNALSLPAVTATTLNLDDTSTVTQTGALTLTNLSMAGAAGAYTLTNASNSITGSVAANTGSINLSTNNTSFTVGTVNSINGITTTGNTTLAAGTGTITSTQAMAVGAGNLSLTADDLALGANLSGTGTLTLQPTSNGQGMKLGGVYTGTNAGYLTLSTTELGYLVDGWSHINIGNTTTNTYSYFGATSWTDPVTFRSGYGIYVDGNMSGSGNASYTFSGGWLSMRSSSTISTAGQAIDVSAITTNAETGNGFSSNGGNISMGSFQMRPLASTFTFNSGGGNISFASTLNENNGSTAGKNLVFNAGTGTVGFGSTINGAYNLTVMAGSITFGGAVGNTTALGTVSLTSTNSLTLPSITAASITAQTTGASSDITIASGKTLTASGSGSAITLAAARNFINSLGSATPLVAASGRWLVYSTNPSADTRGGMTSGFVRYGCTYGGSCPTGTSIAGSGNGFVFTYQPTLTITPSALAAITYGAAAPSLVGYSYSSSGYVAAGSSVTGAAESTADTLGGTLTGTTTYTAGSNVGSYNVNYSSGTLTSALGYAFTYANNASAITVGQRTLTAGLTGAVSKTYDATTAATLASSNYSLSNVYSTDDVSISTTSGTYADANVGTGKTISVSGLTLGGTKAANYTLASGSASGAIGAITKAALTATADTKTISAGATVPAGSATYSGFVGGETSAVIDTLATIASAQSGTPAAGTYTGNYTASSAVDNNYSFSYVAGDLLVTAGSGGGSGGSGTTTTTLPPTVELAFNHALVSITPPSAMLDLRPLLSVTSRGDSSQVASANEARPQHRIHTRNEVAAGRLLEDALIYVTPSLARELELDQSQI